MPTLHIALSAGCDDAGEHRMTNTDGVPGTTQPLGIEALGNRHTSGHVVRR